MSKKEKKSITKHSKGDIKEITRPMRMGCILWYKKEEKKRYVFGEGHYGYSDFGGGCKVRWKESALDCIKRELKEEIPQLYDDVEKKIDSKEYTIYISKTDFPDETHLDWGLMLIEINPEILTKFKKSDEIHDLIIVDEENLEDFLTTSRLNAGANQFKKMLKL